MNALHTDLPWLTNRFKQESCFLRQELLLIFYSSLCHSVTTINHAMKHAQETQLKQIKQLNPTQYGSCKTVRFTCRKSILCNLFSQLYQNAVIGISERTVTAEFSFINEKGFIRPACPYLTNEGSTHLFPGIMLGCSQFSNHIKCLHENHISSNVRFFNMSFNFIEKASS